ncbi:ferrous iron transport protein B [Helicobacter heilmannii]|uniref:Ferrous iron transport protein B n=1 Tax=Helicobacter heilmannii TaxID=35817 RepID=A0A0K2Y721_HELHE|nr:ferrous iron transport protein B [Helicobacter heilmannii]CCM11778.1 Ferrous iron transport protein B [Helicobacter heilmannii ASB1.4]CRF45999.1 Ferrous iron transport protein B [Helicobacter heilmannii]CRI33917.1 Ferrous iron transport protein B [Helicobacter heilmannii]
MQTITVALVGQPNVGKSSLINALSGAHLKVGNFAGVTVEKTQVQTIYKDTQITIIDLPGIYALNGFTLEEKLTRKFLDTQNYDLILNVLDCTNLERNLALSAQLLKLSHKTLLALNMFDEAQQEGLEIDTKTLAYKLNAPCIPTSAYKHININALLDAIIALHNAPQPTHKSPNPELRSTQADLHFCRQLAKEVSKQTKPTPTRKLDRLFLHEYYGLPIFLGLMFLVFALSFFVGGLGQDLVDNLFAFLSQSLKEYIPNAQIASMLSDGVVAGVGAVLSFLPLIVVLYLGIGLLEGTGYMSRVAFLLDGILRKFGLHGKSFIPLVTGFGCSVPAYMATRTLQNQHEKLITLFVIGFMSCSARLPIYVLFIGSFFPQKYASFILFAIYILGALVALLMAKFLNLSVFRGKQESFVMEMPKYRLPSAKVLFFGIYTKSLSYIKKAGTYILGGSLLIWFASQYPKPDLAPYEATRAQIQKNSLSPKAKEQVLRDLQDKQDREILENSFVGRIGRGIDGVFQPMDFDWRLSVSLVTGFMAKEVVVSTLAVLYAGQKEPHALRQSVRLPSAIAFIVFVMFYIPCFAATITFGKEAGGFKFVVYLFVFTTAVAYVFSLIAYGVTSLFVS